MNYIPSANVWLDCLEGNIQDLLVQILAYRLLLNSSDRSATVDVLKGYISEIRGRVDMIGSDIASAIAGLCERLDVCEGVIPTRPNQ